MSVTCPRCRMTSEHPVDASEGYCAACHDWTRAQFLLDVAASQERVLLLAVGVVWEGHIESCVDGTVVAVVRPVGLERQFEQKTWHLEHIEQMARAEDAQAEEGTDPLQVYARSLAEEARAYGRRSLAEQLVHERMNRGSE